MIRNNNEIFITEDESKTCKLDGKIFTSSKKMMWYVRKTYGLDFEHYILKAYYNNIHPVCLKTGNIVIFKPSKLGPFFHNYSKNSFPRKPHTTETKEKIKIGCELSTIKKYGVKNVFETDWCKEKIKQTIIKKYGVSNIMENDEMKKKVLKSYFETIKHRPHKIYNSSSYDPNKSSSLELDLRKKLQSLNIKFESPFFYNGKRYDFYIPDIKSVVEIDGEVFHKNVLENLTLININGSVNDYKKNNIIKNTEYDFYRIRYNPLEFIFNSKDDLISDLNKFKYNPNYSLQYKQKIVDKKYFKHYININSKEKLKKYSYYFLKFIRTFQPEFPYPDLEEDLGDVIDKISKYDLSNIYDETTKEFSNNISTIGHNYLKHYFHSYWDSKFNNNPSPKEAWKNDNIMRSVIEYRIGCNDSNEVFDFSLHQLVRGLSARRITVSFFKPILAASIYNKLLGDKKEPTVLDPCCGFGGRLLGFKSRYPNGTYIGCEPNIETYNELIRLKNEAKWDKVEIYNCKFEDFVDKYNNYDLIFTSIPYYDLEIYDNKTTYKSFDEWRNTFIKSIEKYKDRNCYINLPIELSNILNWNNIYGYIKNNKTHFSKTGGYKNEVIIKL